jgi:TRAP-type transport system periplasmic protein
MKKILGLLAFALALLAPAVSCAQTVKLGTLAPEGSVWYNVLREMGEEWKKVSNGRVQLRIYPGGVAGDDADMVRKMRIGQLQAAAVTGHGLETIDADASVFQTPMLLRTDQELDYLRGELGPGLAAALEAKGFKVLYWSEVGWVYLFSNKPVKRPADLKRLSVWVWSGDAAWADALKDAGYKPVALPATEITTALSSGLIDAFATTPVAALSYQWFGQAKNMMDMKWAPLTAAVVISKKTWDQIPAELRPALEAAAVKAGDAAKAEIRTMETDAIKAMQGYGLNVNPVAPEAVAEWRAEIKRSYPKLLGKSVPREIYERAAALLDAYRATHSAEK